MSSNDDAWQHQGRTIKKEIRTTAEPALAFRAWAEPDKLAHFFVDAAEGEVAPGGTYLWSWESFGMKIPYSVLEVVPDERLVLSAGPPGVPPGILEITIKKDAGETVVTLVNSGFSEEASFDFEFEGIDSGWQRVLAIMKRYIERHFGQERSQFLVLRPGGFELDAVVPWFRESDRLAHWLVDGEAPSPDQPFTVTLQGGRTWSGTLLTQTLRDSTYSWDEVDGVLELTAFKMGPGQGICVRGHGWGLDAGVARDIQGEMESAVGRLLARLA